MHRNAIRLSIGAVVLIGAFTLGAQVLSWFGVDALSATVDLPMKLQAVHQRIDAGTFWFPARTAIDPDGRLDGFYRTGYFSGPDERGRYWSYYANPYTLTVSYLVPLFGIAVVPALNFILIVIGAMSVWMAVAVDAWRRRVAVELRWIVVALVLSTLWYYGLFFWEIAPVTGLALLGIGMWWRSRSLHGFTQALAMTSAGISFGIAVATRYEVAWLLIALALVVLVRLRHDRRTLWTLAVTLAIAFAVFALVGFWFWRQSNGLAGGQLLDHLRGGDSRLAILWHNTFDFLIPNVVRQAFSDRGVQALRFISVAAFVIAGAFTIMRWKWRTSRAHIPALTFAFIGSAASAAFWPYGLFAIAPWVFGAPLFLTWNDDRRADDPDAATCADILSRAALIAWPIGLAVMPITGGGQFGPRFFLLSTSVFALCGLAVWRHRWRGSSDHGERRTIVLVALLFAVTAYHSAYYLTNNAYAARYVRVWSRAVAASPGPVVFVNASPTAPQYIAGALRGREIASVATESDYPYLGASLVRAEVPALTLFGEPRAVGSLATALDAYGYAVRETRDLPHGMVISALGRLTQ
ncbi:hypothetical protein HY635_01190 [Candidatus Uhrbacteria bacterium]|nr:hypothetical protein [Candidatus Uhrbacteria bacterium]